MSETAIVKTYRIRLSYGLWFVKIYEGFGLDKPLEYLGPFDFKEACKVAEGLDIPDGDKGEQMANVRGFNSER